MNEELERYEKLLKDWDAGKGERPRPPESAEAPRPARTPPPSDPKQEPPRAKLRGVAEAGVEGRFPRGTLLCLNDEELAVYRRPIAGKSYDMVYALLADGSAKIEAMELGARRVATLGRLDDARLKQLQTEMRWSRGLIAPACENPEDRERIPDPGEIESSESVAPPRAAASAPPPAAAESSSVSTVQPDAPERDKAARVPEDPKTAKTRVRRGQRVTIKFGDRDWDCVYWGKDQRGSVVAHKTHGHWTLMHLDLNRFKESMVLKPEPDASLIEEINGHIQTQAGNGAV